MYVTKQAEAKLFVLFESHNSLKGFLLNFNTGAMNAFETYTYHLACMFQRYRIKVGK